MNQQRAFTVGIVGRVWLVENKTSAIYFNEKETAETYISQFPASIGGGMHVTEIQVLGLAKPIERLECH